MLTTKEKGRYASLSNEAKQTAREKHVKWRLIPRNRLKQLVCAHRRSATLDFDLLLQRAKDLNWKCEITGASFVFDSPRHPCSLSLDRIDPKLGYTIDNVRLVCLWINYAMGEWGLTKLTELLDDWENNANNSLQD